ncbi:synaptosomal-associated protein 47 isoform X1 [Zonotrichia albicollis]|uniref:synaptosomal-associated protein 47 isoform X1 n=1 Tax=Zonotrichia albicollis TaxID=44394 RepID=UPI003D80D803
MSEDIRIHSWPCSYYLDSSKQWIPGKLSLTPTSIKFTADRSGELLADFQLSGISEIKKESSHLIFSSLTVLEKGAKHWFGSLQPNRNVVFNVLEHFWREQLLPGREGAAGAASGSSKGRELSGMLEGSQKRLEDTAKVLQAQGEQFDSIMRGLHKIEGDMDVADRLLTELESPSWWPFSTKLWKSPVEAKPKETPAAPDPKIQEGILLRIPVIITHRTDSGAKPGQLTVLPSGLEIRDCNSQLLHRFEARDVDDIRVHTPYEISVRQRFIGRPDVSFRLLAARMPQAIPLLQMQFSKKIQFLEDALGFAGASKSPQADLGTSIWQAASGFLGAAAAPEGPDKEQVQLHKVSQEEAKELRQILQKLKGLALETEAELERQDEALDSIGSSADRATLTIERQNRRMRKLT